MPDLRNVLSDYGRWSQAHPWKSAAIGFVPGVGQAQGVADTAEALNRKAYGEAGLNALMTAFPFGRVAKALKGRAGIVAGEGAKTANKEALAKAQALARLGTSREDIHATTGWWQGPDKKWRFEIDDSSSALDTSGMMGYGADRLQHGGKLGDVMQHGELYAAYPDARGIGIEEVWIGKNQPLGGAYNRTDDAISARGPDNSSTTNVALHEMQHAVQQREGFARGGNPSEFVAEYQSILKGYNDQIAEINELMKAARGTPRYVELMDMRSALVKEIHKIEGAYGIGATEKGHDMYKRLAGEAEARAVQKRMDLTAQQRAKRPFWEDLDVPESEQIIR